MKRTVALLILFVACFVLTASLVGGWMPEPYMGQVSDKLAWFEAHREDYDVLFFGSSRVYRGIVPEVFDREMTRRGHPVRSFNFGVAGMAGHETSALVRRVLEHPPPNVRWVVVELDGWDGALRPENRFKSRTVAWHDLPETLSAARMAWHAGVSDPQPAGPIDRIELVTSHMLHLAARDTASGRGRALLARLGPRARRRAARGVDFSAGGFEPFSESAYGTPSTHPFRRRFLQMIPTYRDAVEQLGAANHTAAAPSPDAVAALAAQDALIRRAGATPIHLITPSVRPTPVLYRLAASGGDLAPRLLAFNDPARYPELFTVEHRFDAEHLSTEGARLFSRALAERFAHLLDEADRAPGSEEYARAAVQVARKERH